MWYMSILFLIFLWFSFTSQFSSSWIFEVKFLTIILYIRISFFIRYRNNHQSFSPPKLNISLQQPSHVEFEGEIDDDEHRLNIDDSKEQNTMIFDNDEQSSDDEQVRQ